ncbi:MAG: hypothetical protein AAF456_03725 [Planctomycetota bacterium]
MNWIQGSFRTCSFELRRSLTNQRIAVSAVMVLFPSVILGLVHAAPGVQGEMPVEVSQMLILLLVGLVTILSLLLWATPNVHSELEGKSWVFIASRPGGRVSNFLGKYFASVYSSFIVSWAAVTLSVLVVNQVAEVRDPLKLWSVLSIIFLIACVVYGAIFSMIGTIFYRRGMVIGVAYVLVSDVLVANLPAIIGKLTVRYHLQSLGIAWMGWLFPGGEEAVRNYNTYFGKPEPWFNLTCLFVMMALCLGVGTFVIVSRQYITKDES